MGIWIFSLLWLGQDAPAQTAQSQAARVRAAMEASIAKQRASVQQQIQAIKSTPQAAAQQSSSDGFWAPAPAWHPPMNCEPVAEPELAKMIGTAAQEHQVDPALLREVAKTESAFYPCAVSSAGAQGLMQLMPGTAADLAVRDPYDPQESLAAGAKLLKQLLERYNGSIALALSAYNAGAGRVDRSAGIPAIPETENYVSGIISRLKSESGIAPIRGVAAGN